MMRTHLPKVETPSSRWHGEGAGETKRQRNFSGFHSAGNSARYFVAEVDATRKVTRQLSGASPSLDEAIPRLEWIQRRHPSAVIVRDLLLREVLV